MIARALSSAPLPNLTHAEKLARGNAKRNNGADIQRVRHDCGESKEAQTT
jgi:hypothetical protein